MDIQIFAALFLKDYTTMKLRSNVVRVLLWLKVHQCIGMYVCVPTTTQFVLWYSYPRGSCAVQIVAFDWTKLDIILGVNKQRDV